MRCSFSSRRCLSCFIHSFKAPSKCATRSSVANFCCRAASSCAFNDTASASAFSQPDHPSNLLTHPFSYMIGLWIIRRKDRKLHEAHDEKKKKVPETASSATLTCCLTRLSLEVISASAVDSFSDRTLARSSDCSHWPLASSTADRLRSENAEEDFIGDCWR